MKKIKIKSHSNLQPFKNTKVRHFIWGFNEVSLKISTECVRMYNFRPKELERYNYFIIYVYEKNKNKKSFKFAALQEHESATFHLGFQRGFLSNFKRVCTNVEFSAERTWTIQLFHYLCYEKIINKKSFKFATLQEHESATFHLGFKRGFVLNFNRVRTNL
jgi:hypothetical protein